MSGCKKNRCKWFVAMILLAVLLFAFFYCGLTVKRYVLHSDRVEHPVRFVVISDLHSHVYGKNQKKIIGLIQKQQPDVILLVGDIVDDEKPQEGAQLFFDGVKDIAPAFYVTGNHEHWFNDEKKVKQMVRGYGICVLEDEVVSLSVKGTVLQIAGLDDPEKARKNFRYSQEKSMERAFGGMEQLNGYRILLAHRPELIEKYKQYSFDLVVSGHTHGGQVRIPFISEGLYAPNQGWFPFYPGGLYQHKDGALTHIVSRGVSYNEKLPRVFNPPQIVVIDLQPNDHK